MNQDLETAYQIMSLTHGGKIDFHNVLSKLPGMPWSKYKGEKHLPGHQFTGPQTALDKRLDANDNPLPHSMPINRIDAAAYRHDLAYRDAGEDLSKKHQADREMIDEMNNIQDPSLRERLDRFLVKNAMKAKLAVGASLAKELHKPYRKPKNYLTVKVFNLNDIWTADVMFIHDLKALIVMDIYSRYLWAEPIPNKNAPTVKNAFEKIVKRAKTTPKKLWVDRGTEFYNSIFQKYLLGLDIEMYSTYNEGKAVMAERVIRTVKEKMYKIYTDNPASWESIMKKVVTKYNNTVHSSIKETPFNAFKDPEIIRDTNTDHNFKNEAKATSNFTKPKSKKYKFKVGDRVRIFKYKNKFEKGYTAKWTNEIFRIDKILHTSPVTFKIKDLSDEPILGTFYTEELQKTTF